MLSRIKGDVTLLLMVLELTSSAMVLPRPPSSPNHIRHDYVVTDSKNYNEKVPSVFFQSTNVEKPDVNGVKLLEIEVQDIEGGHKPLSFHGFVEAVLEDRLNDSFPSPEVLPNALLGVRNVGIAPPRYQPEKKLLYPNLDLFTEKLYYLKHDSPKVYVNVRGHTGNYRKDTMVGPKPPSQTTVELRDTTASVKKRSKVPKKFDATRHSVSIIEKTFTTESPVVTSSELPKQIPAPPSKVPVRFPIVHTTPVQRQPRREVIYVSTET